MWSNTTWVIMRWTHTAAAFALGVIIYGAEDISAIDPARIFVVPLLFVTGLWLGVGRVRAARRRKAKAGAAGAG